MIQSDPIAAIATPHGTGAIAVIRVSGTGIFPLLAKIWKGKNIDKMESHTAHLGEVVIPGGETLDHAVMTIFRGPRSFTGEDSAEIAVHGSKWIQNRLLSLLVETGIRPANPGEFSQRAFFNGRLDLTQAEAIADIIAADSRAAHSLAISQAKGQFSKKFNELRDKLIHLASLIELEVDFSEEDVEFVDRAELAKITREVKDTVDRLADTFADGQAFKNGIPVAITGAPNAGKSSLLNILLNDDKAIVSDIPGTTRDTIEDTAEIGGILFRFIDTAGLRETSDTIERLGIQRTHAAIKKARIILNLTDISNPGNHCDIPADKPVIELLTKSDLLPDADSAKSRFNSHSDDDSGSGDDSGSNVIAALHISSRTGHNIEQLKTLLADFARSTHNPDTDLIITNQRHHHALRSASASLSLVLTSLGYPLPTPATADSSHTSSDSHHILTESSATSVPTTPESIAFSVPTDLINSPVPTDLIALDLRDAIHHLATLTGAITTDDILASIFSSFCIGK